MIPLMWNVQNTQTHVPASRSEAAGGWGEGKTGVAAEGPKGFLSGATKMLSKLIEGAIAQPREYSRCP